MSGEAGGGIFLGLGALAVGWVVLPYVLAGVAVVGVGAAARAAVSTGTRYAASRQQRNTYRNDTTASYGMPNINNDSGLSSINDTYPPYSMPNMNTDRASSAVASLRDQLQLDLAEQSRLALKTSDELSSLVANQRDELLDVARQQDVGSLRRYMSKLTESHAATMHSMERTQELFNSQYQKTISDRMVNIKREFDARANGSISKLNQLASDLTAKETSAADAASAFIEDAKSIALSLEKDMNGVKFAGRELSLLLRQIDRAIDEFNRGIYEAAIIAAKDASVKGLEAIYQADARRQEWENYYRAALELSEDAKARIEAQRIITEETKVEIEKLAGEKLDDELIGMDISRYTGMNEDGVTMYEHLTKNVTRLYDMLRGDKAEDLSTAELKRIVASLHCDLIPSVMHCVERGVDNMCNAFKRQDISDDIIEFFEDHNFTYTGYHYEDGRHDKSLHFGLKNESTGEELIISLSPELVAGGHMKINSEIKQISGDELNEERKKFYRDSVMEAVAGKNPGAKVEMHCKEETRNKLSSDKTLKTRMHQ